MTKRPFDRAITHLADALRSALGTAAVHENQALAPYTTFRIGGPADLLAVAHHQETLCRAVTLAWEYDIPCLVLGRGSNVLVSDAGVRGLVVINQSSGITFSENQVNVESGELLSALAHRCIARGLAGLEWAAGIPGTVGGAVVGNAGAWGGNIAQVLNQAKVMQRDGTIALWSVEQFNYQMRSSLLKQRQTDQSVFPIKTGNQRHEVVLEVKFALQPNSREALERIVAQNMARRKASQPVGACCGSVFKNPPGDYAGRLIEAAGLKGHRRGGAEISPRHANFIINTGNATAMEVKTLIDAAYQATLDRFGVALELEIELIGEW